MANKSMGQFIAALRKANGMTQQEVADRLNVSNKAVSRWERDECAPDISLIPALAEMFGVTCDELLKGERILEASNTERKEQKTEKQLKTVVNRTLSDYRNMISTAIAISIVGLVCMFGISYGFYRPIIGFSVMFLLEIAASGVTLIAVSKLKAAKNENELFDNMPQTLWNKYNNTLGNYFFWSCFTVFSVVLLSLPLVLINDYVYVDSVLTFKSYIFGCLWLILLILLLVYINLKNRLIAKITEQAYAPLSVSPAVKLMNKIQLIAAMLCGIMFFICTYIENPNTSQCIAYIGLGFLAVNIICMPVFAVKNKNCRAQTLLFAIRNTALAFSSFLVLQIHGAGRYNLTMNDDAWEIYHYWQPEYALYFIGVVLLIYVLFGIARKLIIKK